MEEQAMTTTTAKERKARPTWYHLLEGAQLARLGVQILNRFDLELECMSCHERWSPRHYPDGRLYQGYWKCPNRCNW
jgi:hypothetical protein